MQIILRLSSSVRNGLPPYGNFFLSTGTIAKPPVTDRAAVTTPHPAPPGGGRLLAGVRPSRAAGTRRTIRPPAGRPADRRSQLHPAKVDGAGAATLPTGMVLFPVIMPNYARPLVQSFNESLAYCVVQGWISESRQSGSLAHCLRVWSRPIGQSTAGRGLRMLKIILELEWEVAGVRRALGKGEMVRQLTGCRRTSWFSCRTGNYAGMSQR